MNQHRGISRIALALVVITCLSFAGAAVSRTPEESNNAALAFEKLKSLAGNWEATTPKGKIQTSFQIVSGGHAVMERISLSGQKNMITMYYLEGNRLLLTHYCDSGSRPRMEAATFDTQSETIDFNFLDVTNLPSAEAAHMHQMVIKFHGGSEITEDWTSFKDGKSDFTVPFVYHRAN